MRGLFGRIYSLEIITSFTLPYSVINIFNLVTIPNRCDNGVFIVYFFSIVVFKMMCGIFTDLVLLYDTHCNRMVGLNIYQFSFHLSLVIF